MLDAIAVFAFATSIGFYFYLRRTRRATEVSIDSDDFSAHDEGRLSASVAGTDAAVSRREELDTLRMAFNELPQRQHDVLVMRELEGLSYERIGSRIGLSRTAVESVLNPKCCAAP